MKKTKFKISPIILVILGAVIAVACLAAVFAVKASDKDNDNYRKTAALTSALCTDKYTYSSANEKGDTVSHYVITAKFGNEVNSYTVTMTSEDPAYDSIDINSEFDLYYQTDDPYDCRPAAAFPDRLPLFIFLFSLTAVSLAVAALNLATIFRNLEPAEKLPEIEEIGILGDNTVDNGLSDMNIDYTASTPSGNTIMDSYSDPFASYSGYNEGDEPVQTGFDPNAGYTGPHSYEQPKIAGDDINNPFVNANAPGYQYDTGHFAADPFAPQYDESLNDPFIQNVNTDPNSPFGIPKQEDPDEIFSKGTEDLNDPYVSADIPDPFYNGHQ